MPRLTIRSIAPSELASWAALDDRPDRFLLRQVSGLVERGASRPDWLFVAERDGAPVGRLGVVAEALAASDPTLEHRLLGLWLPWDDGPLEVGRALVDAAVERAIPADGPHPLDFRVNPEYQAHADIRRALAEETGFTLFQEKDGVRWSADVPEPDRRPARLAFRSIDEVGRELFAHTMGRSTRGTFDRVDRHYAAIVGEDGWGREMLELLEPEDAPSWRLAFTPDGQPAGYVLLSGFDEPGRATIAHIGVVPEQRGQGYVDELLGEFNRLARDRGFTSSISDVDVQNLPMRAALERNGHHSDATSWHVHHYRRIVGRA
jgi:RimJ/RimL family protein N-acetyltransferase